MNPLKIKVHSSLIMKFVEFFGDYYFGEPYMSVTLKLALRGNSIFSDENVDFSA